MSLTQMLTYLDDVKAFNKNNLRLETLPGEGQYIGPTSYFVHNSAETKNLIDEMFIREESEEIPAETVSVNIKDNSDITIEVLNGTSRSGLANSVAEKLKEEGYNVTKIGNYKTTVSVNTSIINRTSSNYAKEIKTFLGKGTVKTEIEENAKVDVTAILGSDYKL